MTHKLSHTAGVAGILVSALAVGALLATGPGSAKPGPRPGEKASAAALLRNSAGSSVGTATLTKQGRKVLVRINVHGLEPGFHGFHVHAVGSCVAPAFTSAGGHFNPAGVGHGRHAGDLPILLVNADGIGEGRFKIDAFAIPQLFDADRSALIVHASADNFANLPSRYHSHTEDALGPDSATLATGDSGGRTACGVIR